MNADLNQISNQIIGAAFQVSNTLGAGFLEKVYENALVHELRKRGLPVEQQKRLTLYYEILPEPFWRLSYWNKN